MALCGWASHAGYEHDVASTSESLERGSLDDIVCVGWLQLGDAVHGGCDVDGVERVAVLLDYRQHARRDACAVRGP